MAGVRTPRQFARVLVDVDDTLDSFNDMAIGRYIAQRAIELMQVEYVVLILLEEAK